MNTTESTPAVPPDDEIPLEKEPIALEPLHSNSPDLRIDSKTVSPRSRSKGFCKIKIEVGAQQFTTTKTTMMGSRLFSSLFAAEEQAILPTPRTNMMSFIDNPNANTFDEFLVGLNVTSSVGKDEKKTEEPIGSGQIHHVESGHYFVDRSPVHFGRILHFLRNIRSVNADQFLERYYVSETMALGINSQCSGSTHNLYTLLLELQDEVAFYDIPSLFEAIEGSTHCPPLRIPSAVPHRSFVRCICTMPITVHYTLSVLCSFLYFVVFHGANCSSTVFALSLCISLWSKLQLKRTAFSQQKWFHQTISIHLVAPL